MIFGADVGVPLAPPSLASIPQPFEQFPYFLDHPREDTPSGIGARCLRGLDQSNTNFSERRKSEVRLTPVLCHQGRDSLARTRVFGSERTNPRVRHHRDETPWAPSDRLSRPFFRCQPP